ALAALTAVGASKGQTATAIVVMVALYGILSIVLSYKFKMPISIVWSTPGAAMMVAAGVLHIGFGQSVGAFLVTGVLLAITGLWPALGRLVSAIPKPIANAMLAGVIFSFCVAPFQALVLYPAIVVPAILIWLVLYRYATVWAAPVAIAVTYTLIAVLMPADLSHVQMWSSFAPVLPVFDWSAIVSLAIPLYLVTMASQNVPGIAIMNSFGFTVPFKPVLMTTGAATAAGSFFGGYALNLAAITAALNANEHAHPNPARRWLSSVYGGVAYLVLAVLAAPTVAFILETPRVLILATSGLALFGTIGNAISEATSDLKLRMPAVVTFLVGASGIAVWGIGAAFWALLAGIAVWLVTKLPARKTT
ncbi:MAG: benzoate/H(+) symporter BenE family transporter, partial [Rhodoluna sp.]